MWIHISTFQPPIFLINNSIFVVFCVFVRRYFSGTLRCTLPVTEHSSLWNNESGECSHDRDYWKNDLKKFRLWTGFEPTTFYVTGAMLYQLSYKSHVRAGVCGFGPRLVFDWYQTRQGSRDLISRAVHVLTSFSCSSGCSTFNNVNQYNFTSFALRYLYKSPTYALSTKAWRAHIWHALKFDEIWREI